MLFLAQQRSHAISQNAEALSADAEWLRPMVYPRSFKHKLGRRRQTLRHR